MICCTLVDMGFKVDASFKLGRFARDVSNVDVLQLTVVLTLSHPAVDIVTSAGNIFSRMTYVSLSALRGAKWSTSVRRQRRKVPS